MTTKMRARLALAGATVTAMGFVAGPAFAATADAEVPGDRIIAPIPRPCDFPPKPGNQLRPPRPCLPDVPSPRPCEWNPDKSRCLLLPTEVALTSSKDDLVPPIGPGPYNPIPDFPNDDVIVVI